MTGKVVTWNGVSSATIPSLVVGPVKREIIGGIRGSYVHIPGSATATHYPDKPGIRKFSLECYVQTEDFPTRRDAVNAVASWLSSAEGEAELTISDEPGVFYLAALATSPSPTEWREAATFTIDFEVQPYAFSTSVTTVNVSGDADFSDTRDFGTSVPVRPVIEITPTNGTLLSFSFEMGSRTLSWTGVVNSGQTLTIHSPQEVVLLALNVDEALVGAYDPSLRRMEFVTGDFPIIVAGSNTWRMHLLTGTATAISVSIDYRSTFFA